MRRYRLFIRSASVVLCAALLAGCGSKSKYYSDDGPPPDYRDDHTMPDAVPKPEPKSKGGNPKSYEVMGKRYYVMSSSKGYVERGIASWYGKKFHGRRTSNGEIYDMYAMTAAHKTLPIPTYVEVKNLKTGKKIIVRVNDRGPFHAGRIIDLSYAAAQKLGTSGKGTGLVEVRAIDPLTWKPGKSPPPAPAPVVTKPPPASSGVAVAAAATNAGVTHNAKIYLQVGAFALQDNARRLLSKITNHKISNALLKQGADQSGAPIYRVHIGPFTNVEIIDNTIEQLLQADFDDFHVVIE